MLRAGSFSAIFYVVVTVEPSKENTLTPEVVMASRRRLIEKLEVIDNSEVNQIEVELYYSAGGMNYFNYKHEERGYYLSVSPYKFSVDGHFQSKQYSAFSGIKSLILEATRFGQKKLDNMIVDESKKQELIEYVCNKNGLKIKPQVKAA